MVITIGHINVILEVDLMDIVMLVDIAIVTEVELDITAKTNDNLVFHIRRPRANQPHAQTDKAIRTHRGSNERKVRVRNFIQVFIVLICILVL